MSLRIILSFHLRVGFQIDVVFSRSPINILYPIYSFPCLYISIADTILLALTDINHPARSTNFYGYTQLNENIKQNLSSECIIDFLKVLLPNIPRQTYFDSRLVNRVAEHNSYVRGKRGSNFLTPQSIPTETD